jgi:hypothetical protein
VSAVTGVLTTPDGWPITEGTLTAVDGTGVQRARVSGGVLPAPAAGRG